MAEKFTSYSVDNDRRFADALKRASGVMDDLSRPLKNIAADFYKSQKAIWALRGPGQYPDLAESTKIRKRRLGQPLYPILKVTGALEASMTNPSDSKAINEIIQKKSLILGTRVAYGVYHQSDRPRRKIPLRKFLFIGPEAPQFAKGELSGRANRWLNILNEEVLRQIKREFKANQGPA